MFCKSQAQPPRVGWDETAVNECIRRLELRIVESINRANSGTGIMQNDGWFDAAWRDRKALLEMLDELRETKRLELRP